MRSCDLPCTYVPYGEQATHGVSVDVAGQPLEDGLDLGAVEEDVVDVDLQILDVPPLAVTQAVAEVVVAEDQHLVPG